MVASLRALLSGIIDYAGLFPPARLPMEQALRNYACYRQEPEGWMLASFVCSLTRLNELGTWLENDLIPTVAIPLAVVGEPVTRNGWSSSPLGIPMAMAEMRDLAARQCPGRVTIAMYEGKLSAEILDPASDGYGFVKDINGPFSLIAPVKTHYYEAPLVRNWRSTIPRVIAELARDRVDESGEEVRLNPGGFKLRCGGLEPSAFPTSEQVAFVIATCRDAKVPLKFTAGLHHPIRHYNAGVQTHMHGFINVFVASVLADARGLSAEQLQPIIEDENAHSFAFDDAGLRWNDQHATTEEIVVARKHFVTSFGSCSFDEPRDDLRALGWLP